MRTMPSYLALFWFGGMLGLLLSPGSLTAQQTPQDHDDSFATVIATDNGPEQVESDTTTASPQIGFVLDWKQLLSMCTADVSDPSKRFFFSYEPLLLSTSPMPASGGVSSKQRMAGQYFSASRRNVNDRRQ